MKFSKTVVLFLSLFLLAGCTSKDNIKISDLVLKDEIKSEISEKFADDFLTYYIDAVIIRNEYVNTDSLYNFSLEEMVEEKLNIELTKKWLGYDFNSKEKEIIKELMTFGINKDSLKSSTILYSQGKVSETEYNKEIKRYFFDNDEILKDLFNYFESK
mgnify:FL=1